MRVDKLTIRNCGHIEIFNSIKKSSGHKNLSLFFEALSKNLIRRATLYLENVDAFPPYAYSEKSFHTILTPAINHLTEKFLIENPIRRIAKSKKGLTEKDGHGWVDYWIGFENIEIFLELKQGWIASKSKANSTSKQIQDKLWDVMNTQLDELEDDAKHFQGEMKKSNTFFRVGMMILPFYQWANSPEKIITDRQIFSDLHKEISMKLNPQPNWTGLFLMHKKFDGILMRKEDDRFCYRPGFILLLNVKEIHKEKVQKSHA